MRGRESLFRYGLQPKRFLLSALVKGLADAVRRNDGSAAYRYHRRLGFIAPDFDTNPTVSEALERLLSASSQWLATAVAERYDAEQPVLDLVERVNALLGLPERASWSDHAQTALSATAVRRGWGDVIFFFSRLSEPAPSAEQEAFGIVRRAQRAVAAAVVMTLLDGERQY
jgi:hypothetical protein